MTTLTSEQINSTTHDSLERKVYAVVEKFKEFIPVLNDRYRLGFCLFKFLQGEGDSPEILVRTTKIEIEGISQKELANKLSSELDLLK